MAAKEAPKVNKTVAIMVGRGGVWAGRSVRQTLPPLIHPHQLRRCTLHGRGEWGRERERVPQRHTVHNANIKRSRISQQQTISANLNLKISTQWVCLCSIAPLSPPHLCVSHLCSHVSGWLAKFLLRWISMLTHTAERRRRTGPNACSWPNLRLRFGESDAGSDKPSHSSD